VVDEMVQFAALLRTAVTKPARDSDKRVGKELTMYRLCKGSGERTVLLLKHTQNELRSTSGHKRMTFFQ